MLINLIVKFIILFMIIFEWFLLKKQKTFDRSSLSIFATYGIRCT